MDSDLAIETIPGGGGVTTVCFTPYIGLLTQNSMIPLRYAPLVLELEICNAMEDAIMSPGTGVDSTVSTTWKIQNVKLLADTIQLDNALDNEFSEHLLSGKNDAS